MDLLNNILHSSIQPYLKRVEEGEWLFRQGEPADAVFFIVQGQVHLLSERKEGNAIVGVLETGQFLGEKVLLQDQPHKRSFSAQTQSECLILELHRDQVAEIEENAPGVMTDLLRTVVTVVAQRFERLDALALGLRPQNEAERVASVILYFARAALEGADGLNGFVLSEESLARYTDTDRKELRKIVKSFIDEGLLVKVEANRFQITDEGALLARAREAA